MNQVPSPDEEYLVVGFGEDLDKLKGNPKDDMYLKVWELKTGDVIHTFKGTLYGPSVVKFSPDGKYLVSGWDTGKLISWDILNGKCVLNTEDHKDHISSLSFSKDGKILASSSYDNTIKVWDFEGLTQERERIERQQTEESLIKLNLSSWILVYVIKAAFLKKKVLIISDQEFLHEYIINFFNYITQYNANVSVLSRKNN